jgi:hypothetical protein
MLMSLCFKFLWGQISDRFREINGERDLNLFTISFEGNASASTLKTSFQLCLSSTSRSIIRSGKCLYLNLCGVSARMDVIEVCV